MVDRSFILPKEDIMAKNSVEKIAENEAKETKVIKKDRVKSTDQLTIARMISDKYQLPLSEVQEIIETEQKITMEFIKRGYKVIKKNYLTLIPGHIKQRTVKSHLDGKEYIVEPRMTVRVRVGDGFKVFVGGKVAKMPPRLCRFVVNTNVAEAE
jgi:hypothetical protein